MNIQSLVRENIKKLVPYSSARSEFKGNADIFLDANENPFETGLNRYPDPLQWQLKEQISTLKRVPIENIFLGSGSDEVIDLAIRIFCEPKEDHIITLPPTYGMYQVSADVANVDVCKIPLTGDFQPDVEAILKVVNAHSKILFLCTPNNPTANTFTVALIEQLLRSFTGIIIVDEAYIDFSSEESCLRFLEKYPNLIVMQTFSKAWGLAGIRLGMAFASTEIIQLFNKVKLPYNINQLTQEAALEALGKQTQQQVWVQKILEQRELLKTQLANLEFVENVYPSQTNYLLTKVNNPKKIYQYLIQKKIIVRDRSKVLMCEGCLRFTVGTPLENKRLIEALLMY